MRKILPIKILFFFFDKNTNSHSTNLTKKDQIKATKILFWWMISKCVVKWDVLTHSTTHHIDIQNILGIYFLRIPMSIKLKKLIIVTLVKFGTIIKSINGHFYIFLTQKKKKKYLLIYDTIRWHYFIYCSRRIEMTFLGDVFLMLNWNDVEIRLFRFFFCWMAKVNKIRNFVLKTCKSNSLIITCSRVLFVYNNFNRKSTYWTTTKLSWLATKIYDQNLDFNINFV